MVVSHLRDMLRIPNMEMLNRLLPCDDVKIREHVEHATSFLEKFFKSKNKQLSKVKDYITLLDKACPDTAKCYDPKKVWNLITKLIGDNFMDNDEQFKKLKQFAWLLTPNDKKYDIVYTLSYSNW